MMARTRLVCRAGAAIALAALLTACVPLFLPPVPGDALVAAPGWRLAGDTELRYEADGGGGTGTLTLRLRFEEVAAAAWVAVQWFGPAGGERASASRWVTPDDAGSVLVWPAPPDLRLSPGRWRVVVSVGDRWLRQLEAEVGP